jgi:2-oxoglutarate ferredoxin oxidoreductase subunit alpha
VATRRARGEKIGLLELQTLWPFPIDLVREKAARMKNVFVVEMNIGQLTASVKQAVDKPERVYLANRVDGQLVAPEDIDSIMRAVSGRGM